MNDHEIEIRLGEVVIGGIDYDACTSRLRVARGNMRKAGITTASFHTLRHTHASNLLSRGVPLPAVSARLGHADANVTARVYSHALPADDQRAADTWDAIIKGSVQ
ncbi:MAG TPA: tyrosine-type recombinase/integrase [Candidatus Limnocylindrales bacterium]|nr:tyrosine-type recombinase/integrase [Candidatus Limnocylindrales bacterium]